MQLELSRVFVKVAQYASFSKAADALKLSKSNVSKLITKLENETGTKLILRTTRNLTLTAAGRAFYEASIGPIQVLEDAQKSLYGQDSLLTGLVRITAPEDLGTHIIAPAIAELTIKNKGISFELHYTDEIVDLVKDGFDIAVRIGRINESNFKVKKVGEIVLVTVASHAYLKGKEKITKPQDLTHHTCLSYNDSAFVNRWSLKSSKGSAHVPITARASSNQMSSLLTMSLAGAGIALIPHYLCQPALDAGKLVRILPEYSTASMNVSLISPLRSNSSARLKMTIDKLLESLSLALGS